MPIVTLSPLEKSLEVPHETLLFDAVCRAGLPIASSCSAVAVCGKCIVQVLSGTGNLSEVSEYEKKLLIRDRRKPNERIACMTKVQGDCRITTTYW